jgi:hypothetical protein
MVTCALLVLHSAGGCDGSFSAERVHPITCVAEHTATKMPVDLPALTPECGARGVCACGVFRLVIEAAGRLIHEAPGRA